jgi:CheY-like chemotaxis protein
MDQPRRVLVIDDTKFFRVTLSELLRGEGWEVFEAEDGKAGVREALRLASRLQLILLDLQMPEIDGFEVLRQIQNDARAHRVPVLAMTAAHPDLSQIDVLRSLGAKGFIDKTLPLPEVIERIHLATQGTAAGGP